MKISTKIEDYKEEEDGATLNNEPTEPLNFHDEDIESMTYSIEAIIKEVTKIKDLESTLTDSIENIVSQYEKILRALQENSQINKIQIKYDLALLENKLIQSGMSKVNLSGLLSISEQSGKTQPLTESSQKKVISILKEFASEHFPHLFNMEVDYFSNLLSEKEEIEYPQMSSNPSGNNKMEDLILLVNAIEKYSTCNYVDVNFQDYYDKNVLVEQKNQNKRNSSSTYSGLQSIYLETNPKYTIIYDLKEHWFKKMNLYFINVLQINLSRTLGNLEKTQYLRTTNNTGSEETYNSYIGKTGNTIRKFLILIKFYNQLSSSNPENNFDKSNSSILSMIMNVLNYLSSVVFSKKQELSTKSIDRNALFAKFNTQESINLLIEMASFIERVEFGKDSYGIKYEETFTSLFEGVYSNLNISKTNQFLNVKNLTEVVYLGCLYEYYKKETIEDLSNGKDLSETFRKAFIELNSTHSLEAFYYHFNLHNVGPTNVKNNKKTWLSEIQQLIHFTIKNNPELANICSINPALKSSLLNSVESTPDNLRTAIVNTLLESMYPSRVQSITSQEENRNNQGDHFLLSLKELEYFSYKPDLLVGMFGVKFPIFIRETSLSSYPTKSITIKNMLKEHPSMIPVFINIDKLGRLKLNSGEIVPVTTSGSKDLFDGKGARFPSLPELIIDYISDMNYKERNKGSLSSANNLNTLIKPVFHSIQSLFSQIISLISSYEETLSGEFVNNNDVVEFFNNKDHDSFLSDKELSLIRRFFDDQNKKTLAGIRSEEIDSISDILVSGLNSISNGFKNISVSYSKGETEELIENLTNHSLTLEALSKLSYLYTQHQSSSNEQKDNPTKIVLKQITEISGFSMSILANIQTITNNIMNKESDDTKKTDSNLLKNTLGTQFVGTSFNRSLSKYATTNDLFKHKNIYSEILNNKFLWYDNYSQYSDWEEDFNKYYDRFNYFIQREKNDFFFNTNPLGDRFVSTGVIPNPEHFRLVKQPKDLESYLSNDNLSKYNRVNIQKTAVYKEMQRNLSLSEKFDSITSETKLKVNLVNIIHSMKAKMTDSEILSFIAKMDFIEKLKQEHIDYFNSRLGKGNDNNKQTSKAMNYIQRNSKAFLDHLVDVQTVSPTVDNFSKVLEAEDEKRKELLRYFPEADYKEREEELYSKMEEWLEDNTDMDNVFGDNHPNDPFYNLESFKTKRVENNLKQKAEEYRKKLESLNNNKGNNGLIMKKRNEAERNLIIFSIYYKIIIKEISGEGNINDKLTLNNTDTEYLELIKNKEILELTNELNKDYPTDFTFNDLSVNDIYAFDSLSENIQIGNLINSKDSHNTVKDISLNELSLELSKFIDPLFIENILSDFKTNNNESLIKPSIYYKEPSLNLQRTYESLWRIQNRLSSEEIEGLITMFFVGRDLTDYQKAWVDIDRQSLKDALTTANEFDNRLQLMKTIINRKNVEINNRKHWPGHELIKRDSELHNDYITKRKTVLKAFLEERLGRKFTEEEGDSVSKLDATELIDKFADQITSKHEYSELMENYNFLEGIKLLLWDTLDEEQRDFVNVLDQFFKTSKLAEAYLSKEPHFSLATFPVQSTGTRILYDNNVNSEIPNLVLENKSVEEVLNKIKSVKSMGTQGFDVVGELNKKI